MDGFSKKIGLLVVAGVASLASTVAAQAPLARPAPESAAPGAPPRSALERRLSDPPLKGAIQHIGSALIASGRDASREASRNALGEWYWAFHSDVRLDSESRDAAEAAFDDQFDLLASTMAERGIDSLMLAGMDDVATLRCMRWYFVALDPKGYVLVSVVIYQANDKLRLRDLRVVTDPTEVEAILDEVELPAGDQVLTIRVSPPQNSRRAAPAEDAAPND
ncbi:MAG TPA: hypothetical protein VGN57_17005 [Pirellulaceae bacterium]|jgi:hypothetical protein|nr:hypothetical protein [Pirellulaceae bacterium]